MDINSTKNNIAWERKTGGPRRSQRRRVSILKIQVQNSPITNKTEKKKSDKKLVYGQSTPLSLLYISQYINI